MRSRIRHIPLLAVCLVVALVTPHPSPSQTDYAKGEIIIKFNKSAAPQAVADVRSSLNAVSVRRFASIGAELWTLRGATVEEAIARYRGDPRVAYVEPNYIIHIDETFPNDGRFPQMWGLHNTGQNSGTPDADIDAPEAWDIERGDSVLIGELAPDIAL